MNRDEAFKAIRAAIESDPADPKLRALAVAALIIAEESLRDFTRMVDALQAIAGKTQQPHVTYAGPRPFSIVGDVATTDGFED